MRSALLFAALLLWQLILCATPLNAQADANATVVPSASSANLIATAPVDSAAPSVASVPPLLADAASVADPSTSLSASESLAPAGAAAATESALASSSFDTAGLFGSESSSFVIGTIGEYPSDARMSGGGFGSIVSSIGPSLQARAVMNALAYNDGLATIAAYTAQPGSRQVAAGWRASLEPGVSYGLGVTSGQNAWAALDGGAAAAATAAAVPAPVAIAGVPASHWPVAAGFGGSAGFGAGAARLVAPTATTATVAAGFPGFGYAGPTAVNPGASWAPYPASVIGAGHADVLARYTDANPTRPGYANPATLDPYLSYGSHAGLSSLAEYQSISSVQGPAFPFGGFFGKDVDSASATVISSRIDGVPQAIAGGRTSGRFGHGPAGFGSQSVSAWAEVPDFTKLI